MQGAGGWAEVYSQSVRQDYRRFNPLHRNYCNVLMADGSVRSLRDANRDGAINNGFATDQFFQDDTVEVLPTELFSKASLKLK